MGIVTGVATGAVGAGMSFSGCVMSLFVAVAAVMAGAAEGVGGGRRVNLPVDRRQSVGVSRAHVGEIGGGAVTTGTSLGDPGLAVAGAGISVFCWGRARHAGSIDVAGGGRSAMTGVAGRGRLIAPDQGDVARLDGMTGIARSGKGQIVDSAVDVTGMGAGIGPGAVAIGAADIGSRRADMGGVGTAGRGDAVAGTAGAGSGQIPVGRGVVALTVAVAVDGRTGIVGGVEPTDGQGIVEDAAAADEIDIPLAVDMGTADRLGGSHQAHGAFGGGDVTDVTGVVLTHRPLAKVFLVADAVLFVGAIHTRRVIAVTGRATGDGAGGSLPGHGSISRHGGITVAVAIDAGTGTRAGGIVAAGGSQDAKIDILEVSIEMGIRSAESLAVTVVASETVIAPPPRMTFVRGLRFILELGALGECLNIGVLVAAVIVDVDGIAAQVTGALGVQGRRKTVTGTAIGDKRAGFVVVEMAVDAGRLAVGSGGDTVMRKIQSVATLAVAGIACIGPGRVERPEFQSRGASDGALFRDEDVFDALAQDEVVGVDGMVDMAAVAIETTGEHAVVVAVDIAVFLVDVAGLAEIGTQLSLRRRVGMGASRAIA